MMDTDDACWEPMVIAPIGNVVVPTLPRKETAPEVWMVRFWEDAETPWTSKLKLTPPAPKPVLMAVEVSNVTTESKITGPPMVVIAFPLRRFEPFAPALR